MKIMIASDIHGSAYYCDKLMTALNKENPCVLLLLGDILYHGPRNPLPMDYCPQKVADMLNAAKDKILCVKGNCDSEVDQLMLAFPIMAEYCLLFVNGKTVFATHGHKYNLSSLPPIKQGDILLHGHTHIPACEEKCGVLYLNPGSVSIPKGGSKASYAVLEGDTFIRKDMDGNELERLSI